MYASWIFMKSNHWGNFWDFWASLHYFPERPRPVQAHTSLHFMWGNLFRAEGRHWAAIGWKVCQRRHSGPTLLLPDLPPSHISKSTADSSGPDMILKSGAIRSRVMTTWSCEMPLADGTGRLNLRTIRSEMAFTKDGWSEAGRSTRRAYTGPVPADAVLQVGVETVWLYKRAEKLL